MIAAIFLLYTFFGNYMPGIIAHQGESLRGVAIHQWLTTEGVFGIALGVSTKFVFLFVLFGALLDKAGAGNYFNYDIIVNFHISAIALALTQGHPDVARDLLAGLVLVSAMPLAAHAAGAAPEDGVVSARGLCDGARAAGGARGGRVLRGAHRRAPSIASSANRSSA